VQIYDMVQQVTIPLLGDSSTVSMVYYVLTLWHSARKRSYFSFFTYRFYDIKVL